MRFKIDLNECSSFPFGLSAEADWAAPGPNDECVKGNHCAVCQETGECIAALLIEADSFLTRTRGE